MSPSSHRFLVWQIKQFKCGLGRKPEGYFILVVYWKVRERFSFGLVVHDVSMEKWTFVWSVLGPSTGPHLKLTVSCILFNSSSKKFTNTTKPEILDRTPTTMPLTAFGSRWWNFQSLLWKWSISPLTNICDTLCTCMSSWATRLHVDRVTLICKYWQLFP